MTGAEELPGKANYFLGNDPSKWRTNVPTYAKVRYESVYPGVDLVYYGTQGGELEYDFIVAPGADPNAIALGVEAGTARSAIRLQRGPDRSNRGPRSAPSQTGHIPACWQDMEKGPRVRDGGHPSRVIMPWTRKTTFASSLAPMTTVGPSSLTLFLFMPPTWAEQEATSLTPSRWIPYSTLTSRELPTLRTSPPRGLP